MSADQGPEDSEAIAVFGKKFEIFLKAKHRMMNIFQDFAPCDEAEIWRRTKRGPDEQAASLKGISVPSDAAALASSKRNRSAFTNITNGATRPHSFTRTGQTTLKYVMADGMDTEPAPLFEEDMELINDPRYCVEYVDDIFEHLINTERKLLPDSDYMEKLQSDINQNMRGILIDWLVEVAEEYKLSSENLYLATNYVDRFLSVTPVLRGRLQLVGVAAMLIASKYEEIFAPHVDDFVYITDNTYTAQEVRHMETTVLNALSFNLTAVTPHCFLKRLSTLLRMDDKLRHLSEYLSEITLQEFSFLKFRPSQIGFSATVLAMFTARRSLPTDVLQRVRRHWGLGVDEVQRCVSAMHATHAAIYGKTRTLQASFDKYAGRARSEVSLVRPLACPPLCVEV